MTYKRSSSILFQKYSIKATLPVNFYDTSMCIIQWAVSQIDCDRIKVASAARVKEKGREGLVTDVQIVVSKGYCCPDQQSVHSRKRCPEAPLFLPEATTLSLLEGIFLQSTVDVDNATLEIKWN